MMTDQLGVFLYDELIGTIVNIYGDKNIFAFSENYRNDSNRPTLSLSFKSSEGNLVDQVKSTSTRLSPFFSNLLPEGLLRDFLAQAAQVNPEREFPLLKILGADLPGAITIKPIPSSGYIPAYEEDGVFEPSNHSNVMRFSLAGVQLKFSAVWEKDKRLTIPTTGVGGSWIVKLPSLAFPGVTENEFIMMSLAKQIGIDVPEIKLVNTNEIIGIPAGFNKGGLAYAIQRFDRSNDGEKIHIEDFAQIFNVYPHKKYDAANYQNIAKVLWAESGETALVEFIRRFIFNALIGNGDMHLKNWSVIYRDQKNPELSPAYDFVSTIPYIPNEGFALNFMGSKKFQSLSIEQLVAFAAKIGVPPEPVVETALETVNRFKQVWELVGKLGIDSNTRVIIEEHMKTIPLLSNFNYKK